MSLHRLLLASRPRLVSPIRKRYRIYEREYQERRGDMQGMKDRRFALLLSIGVWLLFTSGLTHFGEKK